MKTIRYRETDFPVRHLFDFGKGNSNPTGEAGFQIVIDQWVLDIHLFDNTNMRFRRYAFCHGGPPRMIVKTSEWKYENDFCDFDTSGRIKMPMAFADDTKDYLYPEAEYVGFFEANPQSLFPQHPQDLKKQKKKNLAELRDSLGIDYPKHNYGWLGYDFRYLYIPLPIRCQVRDMTPEEMMLLSRIENMSPAERAKSIETEQKNRIRALERENAHLTAIAMNSLEDAVRQLTSAYPDLPMPVLQVGLMHAKGETWKTIVKQSRCSQSTVSAYINRFYEAVRWPRPDRRMGMGKKYHANEARDKAPEHFEHPRTRP